MGDINASGLYLEDTAGWRHSVDGIEMKLPACCVDEAAAPVPHQNKEGEKQKRPH